MPTFLSTLCICIVFVPVFLLQGTAKYLFSPLSLSVIVSLLASLALSFTLVPVLFLYLMRAGAAQALRSRAAARRAAATHAAVAQRPHPLMRMHLAFERGFQRFREALSQRAGLDAVAAAASRCWHSSCIMVVSLPAVPAARPGFLPAGRCRPDAPARARAARHAASRARSSISRRSRRPSASSSATTRSSVILDNIGLPYSGINIALQRFGDGRARWTARS